LYLAFRHLQAICLKNACVLKDQSSIDAFIQRVALLINCFKDTRNAGEEKKCRRERERADDKLNYVELQSNAA
jgi:hypothetical protein